MNLVRIVPLFASIALASTAAAEPAVLKLWPGDPPGPPAQVSGPEQDRQKPTDRLVGGRTVMKLGNVATPEMHVYLPAEEKANGAACVICPGGGYHILAWDLEGTEVAEWLNSIGVTAVVLKYRVPTGGHGDPGKWQGPVMDAQRALSLTRAHAKEWNVDPERIGILGFSAGGNAAARTAVAGGKRLYDPLDDTDQQSCRADFAILVYPAWLVGDDGQLLEELTVDEHSPPMFFAHAADDRVKCDSSVHLFLALNHAKVPAELHVYHDGGHGYGLREDKPRVTRWPQDAGAWLQEVGLLGEQEE